MVGDLGQLSGKRPGAIFVYPGGVSADDEDFDDDATVARQRMDAKEVIATFAIEVAEGPDAGKRFQLDPSSPSGILIGIGPACDVKLSDPEISRRHASIRFKDQRLLLTDLDSTNGTFVDGVAVLQALLRGGETVRMGSSAFRVERAAARRPPMVNAHSFARVIGASSAMRRLYPLCQRLAQIDVPLVIEGETGTGKEQLAEALHEEGPRRSAPFVVFDCTAVAPNLIESELFGHERGAFTGSVATRKGVFERAHGGTLLIDEIGDLPLELQSKLLRAIERSEIRRVGGQGPIRVDVRLMAATRRDLDREVQQRRFRDDLFHRIAVTRIALPPLREREGDIPLLARHFCTLLGGAPDALSNELLQSWSDRAWPGNVRELRNAVARRLALGDLASFEEDEIKAERTASEARPAVANHGDAIARVLARELPLAEARQLLVDEFERRYLDHVLETHGGNVTRAAAAAGVARRHLQRLRAKSDSKE